MLPLSEQPLRLLREDYVFDDGASQTMVQRVEEYLERIELSVSAQERADLLEELGEIFEHDFRDLDRALSAHLLAYKQMPRAAAWSKLDHLAVATGRWSELLEAEAAAARDLPREERQRGWLRVARGCEERLHDSERAIECYRNALSEQSLPEAEVALETLLRRFERVADLVELLEWQLRHLDDEEALPIRREIAELSEDRLEDPARAIRQYEAITALRPGDLDALRALERLYREQGLSEEQARVLSHIIDLSGDHDELVTLYRRSAKLSERKGDLTHAAECLEWVLSYERTALDAYADLQRVYCADGRWSAAVDALTRHAQVAEDRCRGALLLRAAELAEQELDDPHAAVDLYLKASDAAPGEDEALAALARASERARDFHNAVRALDALAKRTDHPDERLHLLCHAAELAESGLQSAEVAIPLLESALVCDDGHVPALARLARLLSHSDKPTRALALLSDAARRIEDVDRKILLLLEAARVCTAHDRVQQAIDSYLGVLELQPGHPEATVRASELLWQTGRIREAIPPLRDLLDCTEDAAARADLLVRLGKAARALGDAKEAEAYLTAAAQLHAGAPVLRELGEILIEQERWSDALRALGTMAGSARTTAGACYQLALCCARTGDTEAAARHLAEGLERDPEHPPSLLLQVELCQEDARSLVRAKRALLRVTSADEERVDLLTGIGDLYREHLKEPAWGLLFYLEALETEPGRLQALFGCSQVLAELGRWEESVAYLERLIELEPDRRARARHRYALGVIYRDEFEHRELAAAQFATALEDDPQLEACFHEIEARLVAREDWEALREHYCAAIRNLEPEDADARARAVALWSKLGELCVARFDRESGITALEVAAHLDRADVTRHEWITDLCLEAGPDHFDRAIEHQQTLLDLDPQQAGPYYTLARLYRDTHQNQRARACLAAARVIEQRGLGKSDQKRYVGALAGACEPQTAPVRERPLSPELWAGLRHPAEDALLGELFRVVAPAIALGQAQPHAYFSLDPQDAIAPTAGYPFARALSNVVKVLGVPAPELHVRPTQQRPMMFAHCRMEEEVIPAVVLGRPLVAEGRTVSELEFALGLQLAHLRPEGWLRLLLPHPAQLAHIIEAALDLAGSPGSPNTEGAHRPGAGNILAPALPPEALDYVANLGRRLRSRVESSEQAAAEWIRATNLTALRASLVFTARLDQCVSVLELSEAASNGEDRAQSILTMCRQSVTNEVFAAREQLTVPRSRPASNSSIPVALSTSP